MYIQIQQTFSALKQFSCLGTNSIIVIFLKVDILREILDIIDLPK